MRNPLQQKHALHTLMGNVELGEKFSEGVLPAFIGSANFDQTILPTDPEERRWSDAWVVLSKKWLTRLHRHGPTEGLLREVNGHLSAVKTEVQLRISDDTRLLEWDFSILDSSDHDSESMYTIDPVVAMAYEFCLLLERGMLDGLKRCELAECRKFHVRRGKWCSDTCGSRERVRNKRKRDREAGNLESRYL